MMLRTDSVSLSFGGVQAVREVSLSVQPGELLGLIGPNGAGKTTFLRLLTGILAPDCGTIRFEDREPAFRALAYDVLVDLVSAGGIFDRLIENVMIAAVPEITANPWRALVHVRRDRARARALGLLERLGIADAADRPANTLPLGYLKRMQVARALAFEPRLLLLDEPLAGLNYTEATRLADLIVQLNREGRTVVLVEHNIAEVVRIASRLAVLHNGALLAEGLPAAVMARADVRAAYLGKGSSDA
ncbi:MAG: ATP-binding cassette domain-containing protein [Burkholderiales bacterium]|nr:ATP-binding cassette domain-containing protein [Burkholderiales bacterium]